MENTLIDPRRKRLLYRAMHRGFKEADIILGSFAEDNLATMSLEHIDLFEKLLDVQDQELYGWIIGRDKAPQEYQSDVLEMLKAYPVAQAMAARLS